MNIDNPPVNALSQGVRAGILTALETARQDDSRIILVLCAGRTYLAGADITEFGKPPREPHLPDVLSALEDFPKPVATVLHGTALGGGLELAMACHYRASSSDARLGLPEVNLGLLPGAGGTQRLPRLVGPRQALDMILSGKPVTAPQALETGLVDQLLEGNLDAAARGWAETLAESGAAPRPTRAIDVPAPEEADLFDARRLEIARKARGQIAPGHIIDLVELALETPVREGMVEERKRFLECRDSPQSKALRHVFFAERSASKVPDIPADTPSRNIEGVAVIGAGTMGGGIAMCFANAGIPVTLVEMSGENLERGLEKIRQNYATSVRRRRMTQAQVDSSLGLIKGVTEYADIADVDLVIEAVFEDLAVKQAVFRQLDATCRAGCILATNTSYLDINAIADATGRPADVIGAHFFSPANVMKLLEVVRPERTSPEVVKTFMGLAKKIGKIAVAVGVCHGFVGNRMLQVYARQAQLLLLEGATPGQVDAAMESWGMAMGPLAVGDLAGLDIGYRSRRNQGIEAGSQKEFALADALVERERLGQKTGAGYYRYDSETRARESDPEVETWLLDIAAQWGVERRTIDDGEIVDRLVLALVNEGARILEDDIAARASDIDVVYLNGYGFPRWRGGPMFYADALGLSEVVERIGRLRTLTGDDCWEPAPLLVKLASSMAKLSPSAASFTSSGA
ncbi:MAG: 3-hydroxyacyl-CoA dehydrogenase NAD-binding domain-containing protein, partial [Chromatocurvus sp.]